RSTTGVKLTLPARMSSFAVVGPARGLGEGIGTVRSGLSSASPGRRVLRHSLGWKPNGAGRIAYVIRTSGMAAVVHRTARRGSGICWPAYYLQGVRSTKFSSRANPAIGIGNLTGELRVAKRPR